MVAAEQGNLEIVQELIRRGANVNLDDVVSTHTRNKLPNMNTPSHTDTRGVILNISPGTGEKQCGHFDHVIHLTKKT